ncbi:hypothetical protein ACOMHN_004487 [Nucella lapillus]
MTQSEAVSITNTTSVWSTTVRDTTTANGSEEQAEDVANKRPDLTDTLVAVTIAILAVILVVTLTLIVRAVRRHRRSERGEELGHIPTVSAGIMGAIATTGFELPSDSLGSAQLECRRQLPKGLFRYRSESRREDKIDIIVPRN